MLKLPIDIDKFKSLFINREDAYAIQTTSGNYTCIKKPLDEATIKDHLKGKTTIGLYQLNKEQIKWAVIDIDINKDVWSKKDFDMSDWDPIVDQQAKEIQDIFTSKDMPSYVENSGFKGRHVWIFFQDLIEASLVRNVLNKLFLDLELVDNNMHIEIFPKQSNAEFGNLVKAPFAKHKRNNQFSTFIDSIDNISYVTTKHLNEAINPFDAIFEGCSALNDVRDIAIRSGHSQHEERLAMSYVFGNLGEEGAEYITDSFYSHMDNYDEEVTTANLARVKEKGYKPITCKALQTQKICPGPCSNIGSGKSPIVFWYRQMGFDTLETTMDLLDPLDKYEIFERCYYEITPKAEAPNIKISNFILEIKECVFIDDGISQKTEYHGTIFTEEGHSSPFKINANDFASNEKLAAEIYSSIGNSGILMENISKIRQAVNKFTRANNTRIQKTFGYNENFTKYYTPSLAISSTEIKPNMEFIVDLEEEDKASNLDLIKITDQQFTSLKNHITNDLLDLADFGVTHASFAATMLPLILPFADTDKTRPMLFIRGETGKGKSFLLQALQNFYGSFDSVVSWTSTPNAIQKLGYFFKDALYLVDDFKKRNLSAAAMPQALALMQNYADMTGRSRLRADASTQKTYHIRGLLAITGEDLVSGESSNLARMIIIEYSSPARNLDAGFKVKDNKHLYSGFTSRYIQHVLSIDKNKIMELTRDYTSEFYVHVQNCENDVRIARNVALAMTSYDLLANFMWNKKLAKDNISKLKLYFIDLLKSISKIVTEERSSERFWTLLQEYIATERLAFQLESLPLNNHKPIVGYKFAGKTYIVPTVAYNEVQKILRASGDSLGHSRMAIFNDLALEGKVDNSRGLPKKFNGASARVVQAFFDSKTLKQIV